MLFIIGIGLNDERDMTVRGLEAVKKCGKVYLESYTSLMQCTLTDLEEFYGKEVIEANRSLVEEADEILEAAREEDVAFLVMGDVFAATTHFELYRRAREEGISVEVIHNASILNAVSVTGLQLYKFGGVASIPLENKDVKAPLDVLEKNRGAGLHTLFMLDIKGEEDKHMTIKQALEYLLRERAVGESDVCVGCARLGNKDFVLKSGAAKELLGHDFGAPPHCLVIPGKLHFLEEEALEMWK